MPLLSVCGSSPFSGSILDKWPARVNRDPTDGNTRRPQKAGEPPRVSRRALYVSPATRVVEHRQPRIVTQREGRPTGTGAPRTKRPRGSRRGIPGNGMHSNLLIINKLVEAAGVEPDPGRSTNRLMAHDFRRKDLIPRRFSPSIESPGVPSCPLESTPVVETFWRRSRLGNWSSESMKGT